MDLLLSDSLLELVCTTGQVITVVVEEGEALEDLISESGRPAIFVPFAPFSLIKLDQPVESFLDKCIDG